MIAIPRTIRPALAVAAFALLLAAGCDESRSGVSGKVTFNGAPITRGTVVFTAENNKAWAANISREGEYHIDGLPAGTFKVSLTNMATAPQVRSGAAPAKDVQALPAAAAQPPLPRKYAKPDNGLTLTVTGGSQTFDIELTP